MQRWKDWDHANCPRCGGLEDSVHVWQCRGASAVTAWSQSLLKREHWLHSVQTMPDLIDLIITYLSSWHRDTLDSLEAPPFALLQLNRDQSSIG